MRPILEAVRPHRKYLVIALVLATINQVFSLLDPQIFRIIIDSYATNPSAYTTREFVMGAGLLLLAAVGVAFISRTAKTFQDYYVSMVTQRAGAQLYERAVAHTFSLPYAIFEDRRSGEILQKLQKARIDLEKLIESFINIAFLSVIGILMVVGYAFFVHPLIGILYFMLIPLLALIAFFISRAIKNAQTGIVQQAGELAGSTTETLRNVELVKSLGLEDQEIGRLNESNAHLLHLELEKVKILRRLNFLQGTAVNAMRSMLLFVMLFLIFQGEITIGEFFTLFIYSFFLFGPLGQFGTVAANYQEARASSEKLEEILAIEPASKPVDAIVVDHLSRVDFMNVSFSYDEEGSLHDISFSIRSGETIAFVGASGAGKSTIVKLLVGLYAPSDGRILFNGIGHVRVDYDALRRRIGFVAQETQLFAGTLRENLQFVKHDASDEECVRALEMAAIGYILEREGLDARIGEGGIKLSGGERQRLAIARALLREPELIVFDEATSALDSLSEKAIIETIERIRAVRPDLMIVQIAHRLSTVRSANRLYVLEKGAIVEQGSHDVLLKKGGLYSALFRQQNPR